MNRIFATGVALSLVTCACGMTDEQRIATALSQTREVEAVTFTAAAQTEEAQPTLTPTVRPSPTPLPSPTPAILQEYLEITLDQSNLPPSFSSLDLAEMGFTESDIRSLFSEFDVSVGRTFLFLDDVHFQLILGWTFFIPDRLLRASFDAEMRRPDTLLENAISGLAGQSVTESKMLPGFESIGDTSAALTIALEETDTTLPMRLDAVIFRRGIMGVMIYEMYLDGETPEVPIADLARIMDAKIQESIP